MFPHNKYAPPPPAQPGDELLSVGHTAVAGLDLEAIFQLTYGAIDSSISLVLRDPAQVVSLTPLEPCHRFSGVLVQTKRGKYLFMMA